MNAVTDRRTVLAVVYILGALAVVGLGGVIALIALGKAPEAIAVVVGLAATPAGALASLLASTRSAYIADAAPQPPAANPAP